jgi:hypothetical protein
VNEYDRLVGLLGRFSDTAKETTSRVRVISDKVKRRNYEPEEAIADWMYFAGKAWAPWLPEDPKGVPRLLLRYFATMDDGASADVAVDKLPPGKPELVDDLVEEGNPAKKIMKNSDVSCHAVEGRTRIVLGLKNLSPSLQVGERYKGSVALFTGNVPGAVVATVVVEILPPG